MELIFLYNIHMNRDLETYLNRCRVSYYNGRPLIPDSVYDKLVENTGLEFEVGHETDSRFAHPFPLYSLQKVFEGEDTPPDYGTAAVVTTPKLDGACVSVIYIDGKYNQALTRGDGKFGLDISTKMKHLVPQLLPYGKQDFKGIYQITGEVVCPKDLPNARNYASGALNLKDVKEFKKRDLTFIVHAVRPYIGVSWIEDMRWLSNFFNVVTMSDYSEYLHDGVVFRVDQYLAYENLGWTSHHPRGAYALKTRGQSVVTKLLDVEWNVGKSGVVAPTALLDPIQIDGATISRATLHNKGFIEEMGLEIGCSVELIRSGEIIPRIIQRVD